MKKTILVLNLCLAIVLIFHLPQIYAGKGNTPASARNELAENSMEGSKWISTVSYKIASGDILEIITWKEPDFSRKEVLVRTDGKITFPLLGDIQAAGRTPLHVKKNIELRLKDFVEKPFVTVTVKNPDGQKFYILGEVINTGEYNLVKDLTLLQAFAIAGGFTEWASKKEIILIRNEDGKEKIYKINYKEIMKGKGLNQNIRIKVDDTIIVP
jgi:polysaccharide export outer membrane protein